MKIIYTESGKQALESYKQRMVSDLENSIKQRKYVLGDDLIEITASDVKEASDGGYSKIGYVTRRSSVTKTILQVYLIFGFLTAIFGLFYNEIIVLIRDRPQQLVFIVAGAAVSIVSTVLLARIRVREQQEDTLTRFYKSSVKDSEADT